MKTRVALATALVAMGCGGRTSSAVAQPSDASTTDGVVDAPFSACAPNGVRLCGGPCGDNSQCSDCTDVYDGSGSRAAVGVCWSDLADVGATPCALCDRGQGCIQRSPDKFVCVPLGVCAALNSLGLSDVCWFSDKSPFDGAAVATRSGCPNAPGNIVCGGDCPACAQSTLDRCVGLGPTHPFGVCPPFESLASRQDVGDYPLCALSASSFTVSCPVSTNYPYACAVYPNPPADPLVARLNGFCMSAAMCKSLASALPGGLWCYDAAGNRISP